MNRTAFSAPPKILWVGFLILITAYVFTPCLRNGFTNYDDNAYLTSNPKVFDIAWENLRRIFGEAHEGQYGPLVLLSFALEYHFFGLNPAVFHFTNVVLHLLNSVLVFEFARRLSGKGSSAFLVALLFAIHPMHVEPVAAVSARKDTLYALFFIASLIAYHSFRTTRARRHYGVSFVMFSLALLSKPMAVMLPVVLLLMEGLLWGEKKHSWKELIPFFALSLFFVAVTLLVHPAARPRILSEDQAMEKFLAVCYSPLFYFSKLIFPSKLSAVYPRIGMADGPSPIIAALSPFILGLLGCMVLAAGRHSRKLRFGFLFFIATLLPSLPFIQFSHAIVADRYVYVPSIGLFYLLAEGFQWIVRSSTARSGFKIAAGVILAGMIALAVVNARERCPVWKDSLSLWNDVIGKYPHLAYAYLKRGDHYFCDHRYEKALENYKITISLRPEVALGYNQRGAALASLGRLKEAVADFKFALALNPNEPCAQSNLDYATGRLAEGV